MSNQAEERNEVRKMKSFYRKKLDVNYRYFEVTCDVSVGEYPMQIIVKRWVHYSDNSIEKFKKHERFHFQFINTYRIGCFYPADMEHDAIVFCKSKLKESIKQKLSREIERMQCILECLHSSRDMDIVTTTISMPDIYRKCGRNDIADKYECFSGCED